ncbi:CoA-binding protein [Veillonella intestinalis]|uniref:CoA-binding protein n=1 Tax=Veillonella intestinalis TaxID=2941341 RepID=UPI00203BE178|nr:CoA-binding protein [Veillonella intestinalis]
MTPKDALTKKVWAVLGATSRKEKFGYKIYACLRDHGYTVYPVNPNVTEIDGAICYPSLSDLPEVPEVVDFVVPEKVGLAALEECKSLQIPTVWLQPGADKPAVVAKAKELGLAVIEDCVLVQIRPDNH